MYKFEKLNLTGNIKAILNKRKTIILSKKSEKESNNGTHDVYEVLLYEQSTQNDYKLIHKIIFESVFSPIDIAMLSNEIIVITGRKFLFIFKKVNTYYETHQKIFNSEWAEITKIKELKNGNFGVCGWYGFMIFEKSSNDSYDKSFEINRSILNYYWITDFAEIKDKENSFVLCGNEKAFIINGQNIIKEITFKDQKFFLNNDDYICEFQDNLFIIPSIQHITLIDTSENKFKQIEFLEEVKLKPPTPKLPPPTFLDDSSIYKYDMNSVIIFNKKGIFIVNIIDNERIQVNICIKIGYYHLLKFIDEERSLFFDKKDGVYKLKFNKKLNYI